MEPEVIPDSCGHCKYFNKTGWIDRFKGYCQFYDRPTYSSRGCVAAREPEDPTSHDRSQCDQQADAPERDAKAPASYWPARRMIGLVMATLGFGVALFLGVLLFVGAVPPNTVAPIVFWIVVGFVGLLIFGPGGPTAGR